MKIADGKPVPLLDGELTICRGANGGIQWLASNGRPELAAAASMIPRGFSKPDSSLITDLNHVVKTAQDLDYEIRVWPIPAKDRRYCAFFYASYDVKGERNQLGRILGVCTNQMNAGLEDKFSMGFWKSQKMEQSNLATSPNYTETKAAQKALADLTWYKALLESMTYTDFDPDTRRRKGVPPPGNTPCVIRNDDPKHTDPSCILIGDSKGVCDNLGREQPGAERYSALDAAPMKIRMREIGCKPRWLPHDRNPADGLTKFRGAHIVPMIDLLKTGKFILAQTADELARKKEAKDTLGYTPRPKTGVRAVTAQIHKAVVSEVEWAMARLSSSDGDN